MISTDPGNCLSDDAIARATAWLRAWDSQGVHRTATAGDEADADWLIQESTGLGAKPAVEEFGLDRLDPVDAHLESEGARVPGVPVFDATATGAMESRASSGRRARRRRSPSPSCRHAYLHPGLRRAASQSGASRSCHRLQGRKSRPRAAERRAVSSPLRRTGASCFERGARHGSRRRRRPAGNGAASRWTPAMRATSCS